MLFKPYKLNINRTQTFTLSKTCFVPLHLWLPVSVSLSTYFDTAWTTKLTETIDTIVINTNHNLKNSSNLHVVDWAICMLRVFTCKLTFLWGPITAISDRLKQHFIPKIRQKKEIARAIAESQQISTNFWRINLYITIAINNY